MTLEEKKLKRLEYRRNWREKNRDRVRQLDSDHYARNSETIKNRKREYGTNWKYNLQLLCPTCNLEKSCKDPVEFMQSKGFLI